MKLLRLFGLMLIILALMLPVSAQNFDNEFDFENGVIINYPDDWDATYDDNNNPHVFSDETDMLFLFEIYDEDLSLEDYLEDLYNRTIIDDSQDLDDDIFIGELGDFDEIASYTFNDDDDGDTFQRYLFVIPIEEEIVIMVSVIPRIESEIDEFLIILDILATLEYTSNPQFQPEPDADPDPEPDIATASWQNNLSIDYPDDWESGTSEEGIDFLVSDELTMIFSSQMIEDVRQDTHANFIRETYNQFLLDPSLEFDEDSFFFFELENDPNALAYFYEENDDGDSYEQMLIAIQASDTLLVVVLIYPREASEFSDDDWEIIFEILETLHIE